MVVQKVHLVPPLVVGGYSVMRLDMVRKIWPIQENEGKIVITSVSIFPNHGDSTKSLITTPRLQTLKKQQSRDEHQTKQDYWDDESVKNYTKGDSMMRGCNQATELGGAVDDDKKDEIWYFLPGF